MTENQPTKPHHTYVLDPESATEMARLTQQDRLITEGMQGIFPERAGLENIQTILDVGCCTGGWALDVAQAYPDRRVVGIDISTTMITYAQAQASAQHLSNVTFAVMNALQPLHFAEGTFDLVNIRAATGYVPRTQWASFLQHCFHVLRPGGILRLTEAEMVGLTNSPAWEKVNSWLAQMIHSKGYGFSHDGSHIGILPMQGLLLQEVGCANIQFKPHMFDFSSGTALHEGSYQNYKVLLGLMKPVLILEGITTEDDFDKDCGLLFEEMKNPRFRGLGSMLTTWGEKPA